MLKIVIVLLTKESIGFLIFGHSVEEMILNIILIMDSLKNYLIIKYITYVDKTV